MGWVVVYIGVCAGIMLDEYDSQELLFIPSRRAQVRRASPETPY